jgi:L-lactate dehydrogenase complex protein LldF
LPNMMRHWREREFERHLSPAGQRYGIAFWAFFAKRPFLYRAATRLAMGALALFGRGKGRLSFLPFGSGWTKHRDFPSPQGPTFQAHWRAREKLKANS